ncbi:hypothetical protein D3C78_907350 [compost metagenome]
MQVVDHVLEFFRCRALLGFLRGDEQAAEFQVAGVAQALCIAGDVEQGLAQIEAVDPWPALAGLDVGAGFGGGQEQVGAAVAFAFFGLLAGGRLLQRDHLGHPGGGRQQSEIGLLVVPVRCVAITADGVVTVDAFEPAFEHRAQEFQLWIADDHALHGLTLVFVL